MALLARPGTAQAGSMNYYGGHVITRVQVLPIRWGNTVDSSIANGIHDFFQTLVGGAYVDWLGEYDTVGHIGVADLHAGTNQHIFRGTALPSVTISPLHPGTTLTDADIQAELLSQINNGALPRPQIDPEGGVDTLYAVAFPLQVIVNTVAGSSCDKWCAYHGTLTMPGVMSGVPYAVLPDCGPTTDCSEGTAIDTFTASASHELSEAITDPECALTPDYARPVAWTDPTDPNGGEIGDICETSASSFVQFEGYLVQAEWSQRLGQCIVTAPDLTLCNGANRPCRPCAAADCSGAALCDTSTTSATFGQCISTVMPPLDAGAPPPVSAPPDAGTSPSDDDAGLPMQDSPPPSVDTSTAPTAATATGPVQDVAGGCGAAPGTASSSWVALVVLVAAARLRVETRRRRCSKARARGTHP
jgi:MYXO-CTERM domain-containing protein